MESNLSRGAYLMAVCFQRAAGEDAAPTNPVVEAVINFAGSHQKEKQTQLATATSRERLVRVFDIFPRTIQGHPP